MNEEEKRAHILDIVKAHLDDASVQYRGPGAWRDEELYEFSLNDLCENPRRYRRKPEPETHSITRWEGVSPKVKGKSLYFCSTDLRDFPDDFIEYTWLQKETFTHTVGKSDESDFPSEWPDALTWNLAKREELTDE